MRNRDLPLPPIRIFTEIALQFLRLSSTSTGEGNNAMEDGETMYNSLNVDAFITDEANQRLANDVWIDLTVYSTNLRQLKTILKAIIRAYEKIEAFYRNSGIPLACMSYALSPS